MLGNTHELPVLSVASLFITIGIAVDDVFVFVDTFKQAGRRPRLDEKLLYTIGHAGKATLFTTITSAAAFASSMLSPIPALRDFGLFTALVVRGFLAPLTEIFTEILTVPGLPLHARVPFKGPHLVQ